jgi:membrane-associated phospholipid phosphatase
METDPAGEEIDPPRVPPRKVWPVDLLHYVFFALLLGVTLVGFGKVRLAAWWIAFDLGAAAALALVELASGRASERAAALLRLVHGVLVVPLVFTQVGILIHAVRGADYAATLERIDRALFLGMNPLEALERWSRPIVTEVMQWAYTSYLLLPIGLVVLMAWKGTGREVSRSLFGLLGSMYLSYVGYFMVPASGPNLHNNLGPLCPVDLELLPLYRFESALPGVWLTGPLREWMFLAEITKQDCFPSGHVAVAVVCWVLARRIDRRFGFVFALFAVGVVLSTVYLRYHYVVDVIAGLLLAWFSVTAWLRLHDRLERRAVA